MKQTTIEKAWAIFSTLSVLGIFLWACLSPSVKVVGKPNDLASLGLFNITPGYVLLLNFVAGIGQLLLYGNPAWFANFPFFYGVFALITRQWLGALLFGLIALGFGLSMLASRYLIFKAPVFDDLLIGFYLWISSQGLLLFCGFIGWFLLSNSKTTIEPVNTNC